MLKYTMCSVAYRYNTLTLAVDGIAASSNFTCGQGKGRSEPFGLRNYAPESSWKRKIECGARVLKGVMGSCSLRSHVAIHR